jgi:signal peptidase I
MEPFLRGGEVVTIKKASFQSVRTGDLIFFKNSYGAPMLHRLIKKKYAPAYIQTMGDSLRYCDEPVHGEAVFGKVCGIEKVRPLFGIKHINMESSLWKSVNFMIAAISFFKLRSSYAISGLLRRA